MEETIWKNLNVGDIVRVNKNEVVPADILIFKSSHHKGFCYLQTSNLDGESALKAREALIITNEIIHSDNIENTISLIKGYIEIDRPNDNIHFVEGTINIENTEKSSFNISNVILRVIKNLI